MKSPLTYAFLIFFCCYVGFAQAKPKEWERTKGHHFEVYYRPDVPEQFAETVLESAENDYRIVLENLGISWYQNFSWEKLVSIYIYRDQDDYVKNGGQAGWSHGAALISTKTIRTYPSDQGFFDSLLPHELGHIILHEFLGPNVNVPLWFDEGVAMYQERARRIGANKMVREALENGEFIPLTQLGDMRLYVNSDRKKIELFYAESASIVNFMINEYGRSRFYRLSQKLKERIPFEYALKDIYLNIKSLEDLNNKWVANLKEN